jgi:ADP-ribose pyrophosphatase
MDDRFEYDELVYEGKVCEVRRVGLKRHGKVLPRDLILYRGAAVVLPVLADGSVVLIRNRRFAVNEELWELPAGLLEDDEPPIECAARELTEETGYTAGRIEPLGSFYSTPGTSNETLHAFVATDLAPGEQDLEGDEQIEVFVRPASAVREMLLSGELHDAKSIAALSLYWMRNGD